MTKEEKLINQIQEIRTKNNELWMGILRVAIDSNPLVTKKLLTKITENDSKISQLTKKLSEV